MADAKRGHFLLQYHLAKLAIGFRVCHWSVTIIIVVVANVVGVVAAAGATTTAVTVVANVVTETADAGYFMDDVVCLHCCSSEGHDEHSLTLTFVDVTGGGCGSRNFGRQEAGS